MKYISRQLSQKLHVNEIFSFYNHSFEKDYIFPGEAHDFAELVCVASGSVGITADDRAYELTKGMAVLHKPGEFHTIRSIFGTAPKVTILSFSSVPAISSAIFKMSREQTELLNMLSAHMANKVSYSYTENSSLINIDIDESEDQIIKNLLEIFLLLCESSAKTTPKMTEKDKIFSSIVRYMNDNITKKLSVEMICDYTNLGSTYLKALFKQYTGMGIMHYFLLLKLKKSAELLCSGKPIGAVSDELGFSSQHYFSYVFKKHYSMTPMKYKHTFSKK